VNYQPKSAKRCVIATPKCRDESGTFVPDSVKKGPLRDLSASCAQETVKHSPPPQQVTPSGCVVSSF
jgi:hypothetical protein